MSDDDIKNKNDKDVESLSSQENQDQPSQNSKPDASKPDADHNSDMTPDMTGEIQVNLNSNHHEENGDDDHESKGNADSSLEENTGDVTFDLDYEPTKMELFKQKLEDSKQKIVDFFENKFRKKQTMNIPSNNDLEQKKVKVTFIDELTFKLKQWEVGKLVSKVYDPASREKINQVTLMLICLVCVWGVSKTLALLLKGSESIKLVKVATTDIKGDVLTSSDYDSIYQSKIFKTGSGTATKAPLVTQKKITPEKCAKASRSSSLPIKLINTIVLQDTVKSVASVQVRGAVENYREGEKINGMAKFDKINRLEVIIKNLKTGECEYVKNEDADLSSPKISVMSPRQSRRFKAQTKKVKGIESKGNKFKIKRAILNDKLKDLSKILTEARAIKIENPDGTLSFKIVEIVPGSIFSTLGIEDSDVITQINGSPINNMNQIMSLFGKLRNMSKLNLTISRGGSSQDLDYKFE